MQTKANSNNHLAAVAGRGLESIAAAALLATTLIGATVAHAGPVVSSASRLISADTTASALDSASVSTTSGAFSQVVRSEVLRGGPLAEATQDSVIDALSFSGNGSSLISLSNGAGGRAQSVYSLFFTLSSSFELDGSVLLQAAGNAFSHASFVLEHLGAGGGIVESGIDSLLTFSGTLGPGDYSLVALATSSNIDPNEFGSASFNLRLDFTESADPPTGVPEPHSLALALAGLLACGVVRRRGQNDATAAL